MKALFQARVETGISRLGQSALMTITYKAGSRAADRAEYVSKDWRALWRLLRKQAPDVHRMKWFRVMELTKKKTPHHHLVIGPVERRVSCWGADFSVKTYRKRFKTCQCLAHVVGRAWWKVTGDSYIVHTRAILSGEKTGYYLAKYLTKASEDDRVELGMARRWSNSRGWPGSGRMRLAVSIGLGWKRSAYRSGRVDSDIEGGPAALLVRHGDNIVRALIVKKAVRRLLRTKGVMHGQAIHESA